MLVKINKNQFIMISGYFGFDNCGDEAILMSMLQRLRQYVPGENIFILSQSPDITRARYGVNAIGRLNLFWILCNLKKIGIFISGGGGLLQDVSGRGLSISYYLGLVMLARLFKIPCVIYAQGIGPVKRRINKRIIKSVLTKVNLIMVRDDQSRIFLEEIGIEKELVVVTDPAFLLSPEELPEDMVKKYQLNSVPEIINGMTIGIVIRNCPEIRKDYQKITLQIAKIADYLITEYQAKIIFLPFQKKQDWPLLQDIVKQMDYSNFHCFDQEVTPAQILSLVSRLSLIIAMRFHAIIFATINNVPFIALSYDPKISNYVNSLGLTELLLNLNQLTLTEIDNKLKYIRVHQEKIKSVLSIAQRQYQDRANIGNNKLRAFIEENLGRVG